MTRDRKREQAGSRSRKAAGRAESGEEQQAASLPRRIWDQVGPLLTAVLLALLLRAMVIESFYVPSESMLPTLLIGDHVFVNKFTYGSRIPFTDRRLPKLREPRRGEVAIFQIGRGRDGNYCPLDECPEARGEGFVKRIVGLPGDVVEFTSGSFKLNGEPVALRYTGEQHRDERGRSLAVAHETLDGCTYRVLDHPQHPGLSQPRMTVPPGHYFVLGDNRDNSNDSRGWGTVPYRDLKGPVIVIYWSWNNQGSWLSMLNPLTWIRLLANETRWDRFGDTFGCLEE